LWSNGIGIFHRPSFDLLLNTISWLPGLIWQIQVVWLRLSSISDDLFVQRLGQCSWHLWRYYGVPVVRISSSPGPFQITWNQFTFHESIRSHSTVFIPCTYIGLCRYCGVGVLKFPRLTSFVNGGFYLNLTEETLQYSLTNSCNFVRLCAIQT
jgi:hypothetical protein